MKTGSETGFQSKVLENPEPTCLNLLQINENWFWNWLIRKVLENLELPQNDGGTY